MKKPSKKPLSVAEIAALPDDTINYDDIPELDEAFWSKAFLVPLKFDPMGKYFATGSADALVSLWDVD